MSNIYTHAPVFNTGSRNELVAIYRVMKVKDLNEAYLDLTITSENRIEISCSKCAL